ncbi:FAD-dependent oxidoreductase, partial [Nocardia farcinica]|uniref:FAD-dependent oxidoreductase n=1 Tax=Nocardia farcinica TaxID=37329 RepID=UPI002453DAA0
MTRIAIIGGGPAGYEAALVAAQHGAQVTLIDRDGIGGACVLWDCVPSKTFIASTGMRTDLRRARDLGITLDPSQAAVQLPEVNARVKALALAQSSDIRSKLLSAGVTLISGTASFTDPGARPAPPPQTPPPPPPGRRGGGGAPAGGGRPPPAPPPASGRGEAG